MTDLKPCPFCGGPAVMRREIPERDDSSNDYWCACEQKCCATRKFNDEKWEAGKGTWSVADWAKEQAKKAWNTRKAPNADAERIIAEIIGANTYIDEDVFRVKRAAKIIVQWLNGEIDLS